ncbi:hypothetical protein T01_11896 [Trichinella spiralis]|uniref:Uncharacterized protein n=1 Tax=Trichinella spiralis TaxID=6334 RepID=A0A0V1BD33_TRISP|nr:hypothetical protein T01_11896 [Trichinella spiralis]
MESVFSKFSIVTDNWIRKQNRKSMELLYILVAWQFETASRRSKCGLTNHGLRQRNQRLEVLTASATPLVTDFVNAMKKL